MTSLYGIGRRSCYQDPQKIHKQDTCIEYVKTEFDL